MDNEAISKWAMTMNRGDLYDMNLDLLAQLDQIGRMARHIRMQKKYPQNKWASSVCRFSDWLKDDPGPAVWGIVILVITALAFGYFSGANYR
jgi:hypothetical protein